jgi:hypothetical protein
MILRPISECHHFEHLSGILLMRCQTYLYALDSNTISDVNAIGADEDEINYIPEELEQQVHISSVSLGISRF